MASGARSSWCDRSASHTRRRSTSAGHSAWQTSTDCRCSGGSSLAASPSTVRSGSRRWPGAPALSHRRKSSSWPSRSRMSSHLPDDPFSLAPPASYCALLSGVRGKMHETPGTDDLRAPCPAGRVRPQSLGEGRGWAGGSDSAWSSGGGASSASDETGASTRKRRRTPARARAAATVSLPGRPPHGPHARAVGKPDLSYHLEAMAEIQALVALTRRLEVRGHRVSIAHLEHRSHQGRADAPGLPLGPRAEQEQVVVGL